MHRYSLLRKLLLTLLGLAALATIADRKACAQSQPTSEKPAADDKAQRQTELSEIQKKLNEHQQLRKNLEEEISAIQSDRTKLNTALIDTAQRTRNLEQQIRDLEERLETLTGSEKAIHDSLSNRRAIIAEVLAALQRMGRKPPPAVLAQPEDMLSAVRTSILLGAVLPELRSETEVLANDLSELVRLKRAIASDRSTLNTQMASLTGEQERLSTLMAARQARQAEAENAIGGQQQKLAELAGQAKTLMELIERTEKEVAGANRAAEAAKKAEIMQQRNAFVAGAFTDPSRLSPKIPFAQAKGRLPLPVSGEKLRDFGSADGFGGTMRGITLSTRPKAVVVSPSDGWVAFAGPFRSFGRLLIINAGGGYYLLLAGMNQINVEVGQFVLAGEPVAIMGEQALPSAVAGSIETKDPVLYFELKKDGGSIDPGPWWVKSQSEKVRG